MKTLNKTLIAVAIATCSMTANAGWDISKTDNGIHASTINTSGSLLHYSCYDDTCSWMLNTSIVKCHNEDSHSVLISSSEGSYSAQAKCGGETSKGYYMYMFQDDNTTISNIVIEGTNMGFAFAMDDGQFNVIRFSLIGATKVIKEMAYSVVSLKHKDWENTINQPDFTEWFEKSGRTDSWNPAYVIKTLDSYVAFKAGRKSLANTMHNKITIRDTDISM